VQVQSDRPVDIGLPNVVSVGQSADGRNLAVVAAGPGGGPRLWVGSAGDLKPVALPAITLSKPNWRRGRDEVWVVAGGNQVMAVLTGGDAPVAQVVDASELTRLGRVTALRLSRDGVRVAAIVNNALVLGTVVGSGTALSIRNVHVLQPPNPT